MMESQGPSLSKGLPEQQTGARDLIENSNEDINYGFNKNNEMLEGNKNSPTAGSPVVVEPSSSSSLLENELIITTTCAGSVNEKQFPLPSVSSECCESDQTSSDQDCFIVHDNLEEHLSSHFEHGNTVHNHDEELDMTFPRSMYSEIGDKDIGSFHTEGGVNHLERGDMNLISVDGRVVPEYMRSLDPLGSPGVTDLVDQCSSAALQNDQQSDVEQTSSSLMEDSGISKEPHDVVSSEAQQMENGTLLQEQSKHSGEITIQVYPNSQGISLVTSNILSTDVATFSTQVPAILTEGDAEDSETHYQVVTTSSMLNQGDGSASLDVLTSSSDFGRNMILTQQQQVLLSGMLVPGVTTNQAIHINMTRDASTAIDVDELSQDEQEDEEECADDKGHVCPHPDCNVVCSKAYKLKLHMLSHTGERPFKCPHEGCEWAFTTSYKLKRHIRGHTGEKPFLCPHEGCGKCFTTAYNLKTHIRAHFRTDTHMCRYEGCDKTFPTAHKLKVHERRHQTENKPYKCEIEGCGKVFSTHGTLTSHVKTHSGEKPHPCPVVGCEKRFSKASKLKLHLRSHTGERPFHCDVEGCGWSFTSAYKLKRHMRKHTGERPFMCSYDGCCKSFTRSSHLKTHMLVHTGEKPYVCPVEGCNKAFTAGSSLNVHMCKHTGQKPFKCDIDGCTKTYTTAANLRAHQKRHGVKTVLVNFTDPSQGDMTVDLGTVSCGSTISEAEPEVMYTTIGAFHAGNFNLDDAARLTSVGVHLPTSLPSNALCALVTSTGNPLVSPSTEIVLDTEKKQPEDGEVKNSVSGNQVPVSVQQEQFVTEGLENNVKMDVTEFVVRGAGDDQDTISQTSQERAEVVGGTVLEGAKLTGDFDLCITSMMSHITSEEGRDGAENAKTSVVSSGSSKRSRTLDFRDVHPEDQFAPPAVIFQDEIKSSDTENEADVLVAQIQQSPEGIPVVQLPRESLQINLPQGLKAESAVTVVQVPEVEHMEVDTDGNHGNITELPLEPIPPLQNAQKERGGLGKGDLSPYMDNQSSSEQDEGNGDSYPESTINLQDLR